MRVKIFLIGLAVISTSFLFINSKPEYSFLIGMALIIFSLLPIIEKKQQD